MFKLVQSNVRMLELIVNDLHKTGVPHLSMG